MVARICKRTPTKTIKVAHHRQHRRHRKKSPTKTTATAATIISSINKSFSTCKRRIAKLFSKLVRITTPKRKSSSYKYKVLKTQHTESESVHFLAPKALFSDKDNAFALPPLISPDKRTIFLDLDETLIHSKPDPPPKRFDFTVRPRIDGEIMNFYVIKRPGVDAFLESISEKYEVVVFTAGLKEYASLVLDRLDKKGLISHRLYRDSCKPFDGKYVKDLSEVGRDLNKAVIVDDNPNAYHFQPENAIPVKPFTGDISDIELLKLIKFFQGCQRHVDMRDAAKEFIGESSVSAEAG
ncbi:hypothetical protein QYF36_020346 [Acer negundo]|nr:hypothetical protein QYF36_020346 [Acer negundo]